MEIFVAILNYGKPQQRENPMLMPSEQKIRPSIYNNIANLSVSLDSLPPGLFLFYFESLRNKLIKANPNIPHLLLIVLLSSSTLVLPQCMFYFILNLF